jgi:hypothetical protein
MDPKFQKKHGKKSSAAPADALTPSESGGSEIEFRKLFSSPSLIINELDPFLAGTAVGFAAAPASIDFLRKGKLAKSA